MWLGGGETLPPMISADFSTIVAALDRTSKGFSDCSTLFLEGDCTGDVSAATAVPRIIDIPEKIEQTLISYPQFFRKHLIYKLTDAKRHILKLTRAMAPVLETPLSVLEIRDYLRGSLKHISTVTMGNTRQKRKIMDR